MPWTNGDVSFRVQVALSASAGGSLWDVAKWDEDFWSGSEVEWFDLPGIESVETVMGRDRFLDVPRAATAMVVAANTDGSLNPAVGTFGPLQLRPGRLLRVQASASPGSWWSIFTGQILSIGETYGEGAVNPLSVFSCVGSLGILAPYQPPAGAEVGAGELTSDRILRVLDAWPRLVPQLGGIQLGQHTMTPTDMGGGLLQLAHAAAAAEGTGSGFWFGPDADPVFKKRNWLNVDQPSLTIQSQPGSGLPGEPEVIGAAPSWGLDVVVNDVQVSRPDGVTPVRVQSQLSISLYGPRTFSTAVEVDNDSDLADVADGILTGNQYDRLRLNTITLHAPDAATALGMFSTQIGDLQRATVLTNHGWSYTTDAHVSGIAFSITGDDWTQLLKLDDSATDIPPGVRGAFNADAYTDGYQIGT